MCLWGCTKTGSCWVTSFSLLSWTGYKVIREWIYKEGETEKKKMSFLLCQFSDFAVGFPGKCKEGLQCLVSAVAKHSFWKLQAVAPDWCCALKVAVIQAGSLGSLLPFESLAVTRAKIPPRHSTDYTQVEVFLSWRGEDLIENICSISDNAEIVVHSHLKIALKEGYKSILFQAE